MSGGSVSGSSANESTIDMLVQASENNAVTSIAHAVAALSSLSHLCYAAAEVSAAEEDKRSSNNTMRSVEGNKHTRAAGSINSHEQEDMDNDSGSEDGGVLVETVSEPEFVCVIRPAEVSVPVKRETALLSSASMAAHNMELKHKSVHILVKDNSSISKSGKAENGRPSSPNSSLSSSLNSLNSNSDQSKALATSSESVSEENGEDGAMSS
jgi:hypothetical protein